MRLVRATHEEEALAIACGIRLGGVRTALLVQIPDGRTQQLLWEVAAQERVQIRNLRPQRSTLEEVFLKALEQA